MHLLPVPPFQFLVRQFGDIRAIFSVEKRQRFLLINTSFFALIRILFDRFISDDLHKVQVPIRVIDDKGPPGVKFYKTPKFEKGTLLCGLYFRLSPSKRKLKVRGFLVTSLVMIITIIIIIIIIIIIFGTLCHCLFGRCMSFERVLHIIPFCLTILRMT